MMKVKSILPWYGAKRRMASDIVSRLGDHHAYYEPFCGSMSVLFAKNPSRVEVVNDLHADLINLARVISDPHDGPRLYRSLRRVLCSEVEFKRSLTACMEPFDPRLKPDFERAFHYFVASWLGINGVSGTPLTNGRFAKRWSSGGGDSATRWESAVASLPSFRERLRGVTIYSTCGLEFCEKLEDRAGAVVYCDPPYLIKSDNYVHDFGDSDHERLAQALRRLRHTRALVSYYDHPRLAELYPGWTKIDLKTKKWLGNAGRKKEIADAQDVLLINEVQS